MDGWSDMDRAMVPSAMWMGAGVGLLCRRLEGYVWEC